MKIRALAIVFIMLLAFNSCNSWLDEVKPGDVLLTESYLKTVNDLDWLLTGAYSALLGEEGKGIASASFFIAELQSDYVVAVEDNKTAIPKDLIDIYQRNSKRFVEGSPVYSLIKYSSQAMNNANLVIEAIENGSLNNNPDYESLSARIQGEAYFIRAMANFEQTRLLGKPYNTSSSSSDLAGLYPLKPILNQEDIPTERITVDEAYKRMIADLSLAINLLPESYDASSRDVIYSTRRANKDAARALLAQVYFNKHDFSNCITIINDLLGNTKGNSPKYPLDDISRIKTILFELADGASYKPNINDPLETSELIFDFYGASAYDGPNINTQNIIGKHFGASSRQFALGKKFLELAKFGARKSVTNVDIDDQRLNNLLEHKVSIIGIDTTHYYYSLKHIKAGSNIIWYRSAEFLLMRAECYARNGSTTEAKGDLDAVRLRSGLPSFGIDSYDWVDVNNDGTINFMIDKVMPIVEAIIMERTRELFLEKYRLWELLRLGALGEPTYNKISNGSRVSEDIMAADINGILWNDELWQCPYIAISND